MESKGVQELGSRWGQRGFKLSLRDYTLSDEVNDMEGAGLLQPQPLPIQRPFFRLCPRPISG